MSRFCLAVLVLIVALTPVACGGGGSGSGNASAESAPAVSPFVGAWALDEAWFGDRMLELMAAQQGELDEDQMAMAREFVMESVKQLQFDLSIHTDGTYSAHARMTDEVEQSDGTWELTGEGITLIETGNEEAAVLAFIQDDVLIVEFDPGADLSEIKFVRND